MRSHPGAYRRVHLSPSCGGDAGISVELAVGRAIRVIAAAVSCRGKSGLHRAGWWVTPTRGDPRESATENKLPVFGSVRVKRRGKSPPRRRQRRRHGKPRLEQDQIGTSRGVRPARVHRPRRPGRSREPFSNGRSRGMIVAAPRGGTEPGLQAVWHFHFFPLGEWDGRAAHPQPAAVHRPRRR